MTQNNTPVVMMKNITKRFRDTVAVHDATIQIDAGEVVGFVGEDGAGKTTTISMLLGFISPSEGSVELFGRRVTPARAHRSHRSIGYAAGDMGLPARMTGEQYLRFVMAQTQGNHSERFSELVTLFRPQLGKRIDSLSRGNKQKIALIAAFVTRPQLVVLDEPTSGLDPVMQEAFLSVVREAAAGGTTIFMSSHYLQEVADVCSRVILMRNGRVVEDKAARELEMSARKTITIVTRQPLRLPGWVQDAVATHDDATHTVRFVYGGDIAKLITWISIQREVIDVTILERTLEDEFKHLYSNEEEPTHA